VQGTSLDTLIIKEKDPREVETEDVSQERGEILTNFRVKLVNWMVVYEC
jgi:hypothetical protein